MNITSVSDNGQTMSATDLRTLTKARADHFTAAVTRLVDKGLVTPIDLKHGRP